MCFFQHKPLRQLLPLVALNISHSDNFFWLHSISATLPTFSFGCFQYQPLCQLLPLVALNISHSDNFSYLLILMSAMPPSSPCISFDISHSANFFLVLPSISATPPTFFLVLLSISATPPTYSLSCFQYQLLRQLLPCVAFNISYSANFFPRLAFNISHSANFSSVLLSISASPRKVFCGTLALNSSLLHHLVSHRSSECYLTTYVMLLHLTNMSLNYKPIQLWQDLALRPSYKVSVLSYFLWSASRFP